MPAFTPVSAATLTETIAERVRGLRGRAVAAVDGADAADPVAFARAVADRVRALGRPCEVVSLHDYVRPASLRLEFGRDEMSYRTAWFDYAAVKREVLQGLREHGRWLPALWDERADRSARATRRSAVADTVVIVAGPMLLGRGLDFDLTVELHLSEGALRRAGEEPFVIDALLRHGRDQAEDPDVLVAWDHPDRPAVRNA
ncbi:hypothetical protein [Nocardia terpenica]|uniref:Uridine kinase n=1 Tax=Nocardia terpenica TaxID=455432 RepID=A0A164NKP4_9NOCA|nr:hypothetical protein [Nocardia terpenica]KZM74469.1 hypothetical protein AWN90_25730 [Nocardia terpenica]NQE92916.1 hypothetical protein [Nocardia terpenica]